MSDESYRTIEMLLASTRYEDLRKGLDLVKQEISRIGSDEAQELFEIVSSLFYIDPIERPDLMPVLEDAISLVLGFGKWIIPALVEKLDAGDLKSQIAIANALGRIGADAIAPLVAEYRAVPHPDRRVFILYALGKIKSPRVLQGASLALDAAESPHLELRDTATRVIGKIAEVLSPAALPNELRRAFLEKLKGNLSHENAGIRAKAIRSLGKLAKFGHLAPEERQTLKATCKRILGNDEHFEWDRAYIVRREAGEALQYL